MLQRLFRRKAEERSAHEAADGLYATLVGQARQPAFYAGLGVPDTLDGRFDLILLHAFLVLERLTREGEGGAKLAQALFDLMFTDIDRSLREMGVGDMGVPKRVKAMIKAFYGRAAAYREGLAVEDGAVLEAALARNLYGTVQAQAGHLATMAAYLRRESRTLAEQGFEALAAGRVAFGRPPQGEDL